ncbi:hypothetical protein GCM10025867_22010 [Frondihabitans sucicola]|uniref:NADP-dependent oxidoreductase domain-containing protein n=1 Tax=Frondihabitans sucicola TaxID=1268041 RepID=A0ABN6XY91_9MICO|nr:hypothetical protein GCM10025867_22010 [Frondihabitans sucicola]
MTSPFTPYVADAARYEKIPYDRIGRSGLRLPRISLGLWNNFGSDRPLETQRDIILRAFDRGVTHFDLANNYGPPYGSAEEQFGRVFAANLKPYRNEILISSKAGYDMWPGPYGDGGSRKYLLSSLDASLSRMGLDYVDIFYSHRPDPETPIEETMGALATAVRQGKALYAGISNYSPSRPKPRSRRWRPKAYRCSSTSRATTCSTASPSRASSRRCSRTASDRSCSHRSRADSSPGATSTAPLRQDHALPRVAGSPKTSSPTPTCLGRTP